MKRHGWFRNALFATAAMNSFGALLFLPSMLPLRAWFGLPVTTHPFYLWIVSVWIFLFGCAYLYMAVTERFDRTFLAVGAGGKLSFSLLLFVYYFLGDVPLLAAACGVSDFLFAIVFIAWMLTSRGGNCADLPVG